ncbi:MAG: MlaE family lipid ABC transporter permease subunit [Pseudomonadota bacterium]
MVAPGALTPTHDRAGPADRAPAFELEDGTVYLSGDWIVDRLGGTARAFERLRVAGPAAAFDLSRVSRLDSAGAWLVHRQLRRLRARGNEPALRGASDDALALLQLVEASGPERGGVVRPPATGLFEGIGRRFFGALANYVEFLAFIGRLTFISLRILLTPMRMRWRIVVEEVVTAGFYALPIVGLLAFLLGVVIAYQGGILLRQYGGSIFIADLVGLAMLRELAPLITAIIVSGRTGSAYTAQIGTMKVTEEVDALRTMGITPVEMLVLPKLFALVIALPLLVVFADLLGLFGGMVMSRLLLEVSFATFTERLLQALTIESYLIGIGKAPVFAVIIAAVGCFQGLKVGGSAASVGRRTTLCVVQCIFLVIVVDAVFSIVFSRLGL